MTFAKEILNGKLHFSCIFYVESIVRKLEKEEIL